MARIDVPRLPPAQGRIITFEVYAEGRARGLGIYMEYAPTDSARCSTHFYVVFPHEFQFVN